MGNLKLRKLEWVSFINSDYDSSRLPQLLYVKGGKVVFAKVMYRLIRKDPLIAQILSSVANISKDLVLTDLDLSKTDPEQVKLIQSPLIDVKDLRTEFYDTVLEVFTTRKRLGRKVRSWRKVFVDRSGAPLPVLWTSSAGSRPGWLSYFYEFPTKASMRLLSFYNDLLPPGAAIWMPCTSYDDVFEETLRLLEHFFKGKYEVGYLRKKLVQMVQACKEAPVHEVINSDIGQFFYRSATIPPLNRLINGTPVGRLSLLREFGGKLRVVAIPQASTQAALKPIHDRLFELFELIPSDYTHDQLRFRRDIMSGKYPSGAYWSFDLKSFTDIYPIDLQLACFEALCKIAGKKFNKLPDLWKKAIRSGPYLYRDAKGNIKLLHYVGGQPMGAYAS